MSEAVPLRRAPDWPSRLEAYLRSMRDVEVAWDGLCCVEFACGAVEAMTGVNPAPAWRPDRAAREDAGRDLVRHVDAEAARWNIGRVAPLGAQRGDLMATERTSDGMHALGVCIGGHAVFMTPRGQALVEREACCAAWRV